MTKKVQIGIACAILIVAGSLGYWLWGGPAKESPEAAAAQDAPKVTFASSSISQEKNGKKIWELNADTIEADPDGKIAYLSNLKGVFYQEKGGKIDIAAQQARVDMKTHDIFMQGNVKAVTSEGATFTANEAQWVGEPKSFLGTGNVTLIKDGTTISGDNIQTDAMMQKVKVYGNAKVTTGGKN